MPLGLLSPVQGLAPGLEPHSSVNANVQVFADVGAVHLALGLMRTSLMQQPSIDLVALSAAFSTHVVATPGLEAVVLSCIEQLTEPLALLLQRGATFPWACKALLALLQPGSSCSPAAAAALVAHLGGIVAALRAAVEAMRSEQQAGSARSSVDGSEAVADLVLSPPLALGGHDGAELAASLLSILLEDPAVETDAVGALVGNSLAVSVLVDVVGESGGAKALQCLAVLLADARAQEQLLALDGALDKVALHWEQAPSAAARVLCRMSAHLTVSESRSVFHVPLSPPCPARRLKPKLRL